MFNSKLCAIGLKLFYNQFGEQYKETNLYRLPQIWYTLVNTEYQEFLREENFCNTFKTPHSLVLGRWSAVNK